MDNSDIGTISDELLAELANKRRREHSDEVSEQLQGVAASPEQAEEHLIERYKDMVRSRARAYFLIGADSEDVIQEGMIGLYKAITNFDAESGIPFAAFAELCVTRQIQTAVKASLRLKHTPLNQYVSFSTPISESEDKEVCLMDTLQAADNTNPETRLLEQEGMEELMSRVRGELSALEGEVLELFLSGMDYRAIANMLGKSPKSIDNALQRIKKKVSNCLENGDS